MNPTTDSENAHFVQLTADIVSSYISRNSVRATDLPALLTQVHTALAVLSNPAAVPEPEIEQATPARIRKSITPEALISFLDGKPYKSLKRHLAAHGLSVEGYRARYGLPADYPTVAASYSAARSALAKELGLGQVRRKAVPAITAPAASVQSPRRGRLRKTAEPATAG